MSCRSSVDRAPTWCSGGDGFDSYQGLRFFLCPMLTFCNLQFSFKRKPAKEKTTIEQFLCFNVEDYTVHVKILALLRRISISRTFFTFSRVVFGQPIHNFKHFFSGFVCRQEAYGNNKRTVLFTCEKTKFLAIQA